MDKGQVPPIQARLFHQSRHAGATRHVNLYATSHLVRREADKYSLRTATRDVWRVFSGRWGSDRRVRAVEPDVSSARPEADGTFLPVCHGENRETLAAWTVAVAEGRK